MLKSQSLVLVLCFSLMSPDGRLKAHDGDHTHAVPAVGHAEMYAPTAIPDRVVLTWDGDTKTTQAVTWRTSTIVKKAWAEIAIAGDGPAFPDTAKEVPAETTYLKTDINEAHFHTVRFTDLVPGTVYAYRVGDGTNWSEWFQFRTAKAEFEPFSFVYFGDAQNNLRSMWSRVIREAHRDAPKMAFLLHAGDLVNKAEADGEWGEWFGAGAWLNAMIPSVAIPGNHEHAKNEDGTRRLTHHWRPTFAFPTNGPEGLEESCYTLTYQNMRLIGLNSTSMQEEQAKWLEGVLAKNEHPWVVCTFHHPLFSTGKDRDNPELRALWKPIFDRYKVDLVLQGHDHTYGRTGFVVPEDGVSQMKAAELKAEQEQSAAQLVAHRNVASGVQNFDEKAGTVYVVSVSGPKMYNNNRKWFMRKLAEDTQLYQVIRVEQRRLIFEARTATGKLYDSFELAKRPGEINELIETGAEMPERLRPEEPQDEK